MNDENALRWRDLKFFFFWLALAALAGGSTGVWLATLYKGGETPPPFILMAGVATGWALGSLPSLGRVLNRRFLRRSPHYRGW